MEFEKQPPVNEGNLPKDKKGRFGQWLVFPLTLKHPNPSVKGVEITLDNVLIDVQGTKRIDFARIEGLNGTIKTFAGDDDYTLRIKGVICSDNQTDYPKAQIDVLVEILKAGMYKSAAGLLEIPSISVISDYLLLFGIYDIVITDYNLPQLEGVQNCQPFEIMALSNAPVEFVEDFKL